MEKIEIKVCACQHCESEQSSRSIFCYSCNYVDSCHKEVREDRLFNRGYYKA